MVMGEPERIDSVAASERVGAGRPHAHPSPAAYAHVSTLSFVASRAVAPAGFPLSLAVQGQPRARARRTPRRIAVGRSTPSRNPTPGSGGIKAARTPTGSRSDQVLRSRSATAFYGPTRNCRAQAPELSWARRCGTSALWMQRAQPSPWPDPVESASGSPRAAWILAFSRRLTHSFCPRRGKPARGCLLSAA